jgi:hypothetical protein
MAYYVYQNRNNGQIRVSEAPDLTIQGRAVWRTVTDHNETGVPAAIAAYEARKAAEAGAVDAEQAADRAALGLPRTPVVTPEDHGAVGNGVADDRAALQNAVDAAASLGREVWLGKGKTYKVSQPATFSGAVAKNTSYNAVLIPSGVTVRGFDSTILITGIDGTKAYSNSPPHNLPGTAGVYNAFQVAKGSSGVTITGVRFLGQNDFTFILGHQAAAIDVDVSPTAGGVRDITIEKCIFENLWGFSVHHQGNGHRIHVRDCRMKNVTNTVNVNGDYCEITGNTFENAAVVECSGSYCVISSNMVKSSPHGGFSLGGRPSGPYGYGTVCANNVIDGAEGQGIIVADGSDGYIVQGNTIQRTTQSGIVATGPNQAVRRLIIANNTIISAGASGAAASNRFGVHVGAAPDTLVVGNHVTDAAITGYSTHTAYYAGSTSGVQFIGNRATGAALVSHLGLDSTPNALVQGNNFAPGKVGRSGTTTYEASLVGDLLFARAADGRGIYYSTTLPEGSLSAPPGSLALCPEEVYPGSSAGYALWIKESGYSNAGWVPFGGSLASTTKTANYTNLLADPPLMIFNGTGLTYTLADPTTATRKGRQWTVKNINASALTVDSAGSGLIDGAASKTLAQWEKATFYCDGTQWLTV